MKKIKKALSLLMMSAMLVLPTAMPVQAKEVENTDKNVTATSAYDYSIKAEITASDVCLRRTPSKSGEVMLLLKKGATVYVANTKVYEGQTSTFWRPCKYKSGGKTYYGFVADQYVK